MPDAGAAPRGAALLLYALFSCDHLALCRDLTHRNYRRAHFFRITDDFDDFCFPAAIFSELPTISAHEPGSRETWNFISAGSGVMQIYDYSSRGKRIVGNSLFLTRKSSNRPESSDFRNFCRPLRRATRPPPAGPHGAALIRGCPRAEVRLLFGERHVEVAHALVQ